MTTPKVLTERVARTFVVTINRASVRNCVDGETAGLLTEATETFKTDETLDVMILTGAGEAAFCAGADLKALNTLSERPGAAASGPMGLTRITNVGKPTIAAVNGYCTAGGLEIAAWCDFRIASTDAQFGVLNRRWGVPLVDGGTQRLPRIVGMGNAMYLIITGALIDARHALRMGLVQEVVPPGKALERALEIAEVLTTYPQTAIRNDRQAALASFTLPINQGLKYEIETTRSSLSDPAMPAWLQRFAAGERPQSIRPPE